MTIPVLQEVSLDSQDERVVLAEKIFSWIFVVSKSIKIFQSAALKLEKRRGQGEDHHQTLHQPQ